MCEYCESKDGPLGCPECGRLICFDDDFSGDDVMAPAYVTESGDLMCRFCGRVQDRAMREYEEYYEVEWLIDPFDPDLAYEMYHPEPVQIDESEVEDES